MYRPIYSELVSKLRDVKLSDDFDIIEYSAMITDIDKYIQSEKRQIKSKIQSLDIKLDAE